MASNQLHRLQWCLTVCVPRLARWCRLSTWGNTPQLLSTSSTLQWKEPRSPDLRRSSPGLLLWEPRSALSGQYVSAWLSFLWGQLGSNWVLMSCQLRRVTPGWPKLCLVWNLFSRSHIVNFFLKSTKLVHTKYMHAYTTSKQNAETQTSTQIIRHLVGSVLPLLTKSKEIIQGWQKEWIAAIKIYFTIT